MMIQQIKTFEIDDKIAQHIKDLNDKGYMTEFSCSGHLKDHSLGYILFDSNTSMNIIEHEIKPAKDWFYIQLSQDRRIGMYMKNSTNKKFLYSDRLTNEYIDNELNKLNNWIESLPVFLSNYYCIETTIVEEMN